MGGRSGLLINTMSRPQTADVCWKSSTVTEKKLTEDTLAKFLMLKALTSAMPMSN